MSENCKKCGKDIGLFSTIEVEGQKYCVDCSKKIKADKVKIKADKDIYIPELDAIQRALSGLLTQDPDTRKLFEEGSRTYVKIFGGDVNNFINLNSNLIQSSILLKILEKLERIEQHIEKQEHTR